MYARNFKNKTVHPVFAMCCTAFVAFLFGSFIVKAARDFDPIYLVDLDQITDTELRKEAFIQFGR